MNNFINDLINRFKNNKKMRLIAIIMLAFYIILLSLTLIRIDKEIISPGVLNNPSSFLTIGSDEEKTYEQGDINTIGVFVKYKPSLFQYLISNYNSNLEVSDYDTSSDLSIADQTSRSIYLKDLSIVNSLIAAYSQAQLVDNNISIDYEFKGLLVTANLPQSYSQKLVIGDVITGVVVDGVTTHLNDCTDQQYTQYFKNAISNCYNKDNQKTFTLLVKTNKGNEKTVDFQWNDDGALYLELYVLYNINSTTPTYKIDEATVHNSIGSSGGMMLALAIYNSLLEEDVTKGLKICGTGTIDDMGRVGAIGGIKQKITTSLLHKADIFFAPYSDDVNSGEYSNYIDALEQYNAIKNPHMKLVKITSLQDILEYLEGYGE